MKQQIGSVSKERLVSQGAWSNVEIDLLGPFICHSEVNKRSNTKVGGAMLEYINSGAVYCDIMSNYGMETVMLILK